MVAPEALAYPALSVALCGAYFAGRSKGGVMKWARGAALALMVGAMVASQVRLIVVGLADSPLSLASAAFGLGGALGLLAMWASEVTAGWRARGPSARASSP